MVSNKFHSTKAQWLDILWFHQSIISINELLHVIPEQGSKCFWPKEDQQYYYWISTGVKSQPGGSWSSILKRRWHSASELQSPWHHPHGLHTVH